jgi:transcriptional regulator with XRE-family HTH domain
MKPGYGDRMWKARLALNMTIRVLAEKSGVHPMAISATENEKSNGFSLYDLDRYRKVVGVSLDYVYGSGGGLENA